jgi:hypothetical protein
VIVSCPTCSTHYSHTTASASEIGRCSRCDARFPLASQKPRYIVMPAASTGAPDPLLATGVAETETRVDRQAQRLSPDSAPATALETALEAAPETALETAPLPDPMLPEPTDLDTDEEHGFFGTGMEDEEALFGIDESAPDAGSDVEVDAEAAADEIAEPAVRQPSHPIREALGVFLLSGLGGAAGFHGSMQFGFEPLRAVAVGLAVGLTLGWAWIRWAERKR